MKKVRNLRLEHYENYSSFSYCTQSSVYRVFLHSGRVVDRNRLILFRHSTTGPEHPIYRTMRRLNKFQNALFSDFKLCRTATDLGVTFQLL